MGCCSSCLASCCCSEAGLRCHSVVSVCGVFFFLLMFALFDRQEAFFEFEMADPSGIKWACLWSALVDEVVYSFGYSSLSSLQSSQWTSTELAVIDKSERRYPLCNCVQFVVHLGRDNNRPNLSVCCIKNEADDSLYERNYYLCNFTTYMSINQQKQVQSAIIIQKHWRRYVARRNFKKILKKHKKKAFVALQLLNSEKTYCDNLREVIKKVLIPSKEYITDKEMHSYIFSNIEQIFEMHNNFLTKLDTTMKTYNPHTTKLSKVLLNELFNKEEFKQAYTTYCFNYKTTDQAIKFVTNNNTAFTQYLKKIGFVSINMSLESIMIKPVQRLCKYGLIIDEYFRNMESDHQDYKEIEKTSLLIDKLVHQTNEQVEQFLMRQRLLQLKAMFPTFFSKIHSSKKMRMYYQTKEITLLDIVKEEEYSFRSIALFENSIIFIPHKIAEEPTFSNFIFIRELANNKYYKSIVQLVQNNKYCYVQFKDEKDKKEFMRVMEQKIKQNEEKEYKDYIKVSILGTETRQSFFSSYTVYIVNINDKNKTSTIYPRFKDLLKVQELMISKGMKFDPPILSKESIISTLKSKTIEKRKLTIQQFLERVFNNCQLTDLKQIEDILGVSQFSSTALMQRLSTEVDQISVLLPNLQKVKVLMPINQSKIKDLKMMISEQMGMQTTNQFQIFQVRNKNFSNKKLLYDGEPIKKIYDEQRESMTSINPFRDMIDYLYTRHYYLPREEEEQLYKCDQARAELQLSVIHSEILNYKLQEEVMLTFMCLFAMYIHLPMDNDEKLVFYIKEITKKQYKLSEQQFRIYYSEVKKMVSSEDNISQTLPLVIIKIISNSYFYQCIQFEVQVHHKTFSYYRKTYSSLEQNVILGLHPQIIYLLSSKDKSVIIKFTYSQLQIAQNRANAIVFDVLHSQVPFTFKTILAFEISRIFQIYKKKH